MKKTSLTTPFKKAKRAATGIKTVSLNDRSRLPSKKISIADRLGASGLAISILTFVVFGIQTLIVNRQTRFVSYQAEVEVLEGQDRLTEKADGISKLIFDLDAWKIPSGADAFSKDVDSACPSVTQLSSLNCQDLFVGTKFVDAVNDKKDLGSAEILLVLISRIANTSQYKSGGISDQISSGFDKCGYIANDGVILAKLAESVVGLSRSSSILAGDIADLSADSSNTKLDNIRSTLESIRGTVSALKKFHDENGVKEDAARSLRDDILGLSSGIQQEIASCKSRKKDITETKQAIAGLSR